MYYLICKICIYDSNKKVLPQFLIDLWLLWYRNINCGQTKRKYAWNFVHRNSCFLKEKIHSFSWNSVILLTKFVFLQSITYSSEYHTGIRVSHRYNLRVSDWYCLRTLFGITSKSNMHGYYFRISISRYYLRVSHCITSEYHTGITSEYHTGITLDSRVSHGHHLRVSHGHHL